MPNKDVDSSGQIGSIQEDKMEQRVFYLDFIRSISICLIIVYHYNFHALDLQVTGNTVFWRQATWLWGHSFLGVVGVSLFIILSGASLMLSTKEKFEAKIFFKKRFFSIYPLFWTTYLFTFFAFLIINQKLPTNPAAHPLTFLLTIAGLDGFLLFKVPNYYLIGEWFLGFIIIMYMIFPFLRFLFFKDQLFTFLLCILIALLVEKFYYLEMNVQRFPLFRLLEFVFGMSFIYLFNPSHRVFNYLLIGMAGTIVFLSNVLTIPLPFYLAMVGGGVFICLACMSLLFENLRVSRYFQFISAYSYGAFLIHHFVLTTILPFFENQHLTFLQNYLLFIIVLIIIYKKCQKTPCLLRLGMNGTRSEARIAGGAEVIVA